MFLNILLTIRDLEERLCKTFAKEQGEAKAQQLEAKLDQFSQSQLLPFEQLEEITIQLNHISDSVNCLATDEALRVASAIVQYRDIFKGK